MLEFFHGLGQNFKHSFSKYWRWHIIAWFLTTFCVLTGFDWYWHTITQGKQTQNILFPAVIIGGVFPIVLPIAILLAGKMLNKRKVVTTGFAMGQAAFLGWLISSIYKFFTGRVEPPFMTLNPVDISRQFQFGFFEHGIFWGWPSSHTTVAFAVAVTVFMLYPKNKIVRYFAILLALYIGIGISTNIHWFSDFLAGAIIGSVIGVVVGKSFKNLIHHRDNL